MLFFRNSGWVQVPTFIITLLFLFTTTLPQLAFAQETTKTTARSTSTTTISASLPSSSSSQTKKTTTSTASLGSSGTSSSSSPSTSSSTSSSSSSSSDRLTATKNTDTDTKKEASGDHAAKEPDTKERASDEQDPRTDIDREPEGTQPPTGTSTETPVPEQGETTPAKIDEKSGALTYVYSFGAPNGRNGLAPGVMVEYNSQDKTINSVWGHGWSDNIPYIERINRRGTNELYDDEHMYFYSSLSGEITQTDPVWNAYGKYAARVDNGEFAEYTYDQDDTWTLTTKEGLTYYFGATTGARQDNPDDATQIFKWMVEKVEDANGNYITYEYTKETGQIYPASIVYTNHPDHPHTGIYEIEFVLEPRTDQSKIYGTAFEVFTQKRVSRVNVLVEGRREIGYELEHDTASDENMRSMLMGIQQFAYDVVERPVEEQPPTEFQYTTFDGWTTSVPTWGSCTVTNLGALVRCQFIDIDGDGDIDTVSGNGSGNRWVYSVYMNDGTGASTLDPRWVFPADLTQSELSDIDGDGDIDLVTASATYINDGTQWVLDTSGQWDFPLTTGLHNSYFNPTGTTGIGDVNNDGLPDVYDIQIMGGTRVYLNNGTDWVLDPTWNVVGPWATPSNQSVKPRFLVDFNGDGLLDFHWTGDNYFLNTGNGWKRDTNFGGATHDEFDPFSDFNGDGLIDVMKKGSVDREVAIHDGIRWDVQRNPVDEWINLPTTNASNVRSVAVDLDADGLMDFYRCNSSCPAAILYVGNANRDFVALDNTNGSPYRLEARLAADTNIHTDVNGDGMIDILGYGGNNNTPMFAYSRGDMPYVLQGITYSTGGTTDVGYKMVPTKGPNPTGQPQLQHVVETVTHDSSVCCGGSHSHNGVVSTTSYDYEDGRYYYYPDEGFRKFAGFSKIITSHPDGTQTTSYYHQGGPSLQHPIQDVASIATTQQQNGELFDHVSKIGKIYRTELRDSDGIIVQTTNTAWAHTQLAPKRDFVYPMRTITTTHDLSGSDDVSVATSYQYDLANGSLLRETQHGLVERQNNTGTFVDISTDTRTIVKEYAEYANGKASSHPSSLVLLDENGLMVQETLWEYDNLPAGNVEYGNVTRAKRRINGGEYATKMASYNSLGMVTSATNENGHTTTFVYDRHKILPRVITNPLGHKMQYAYNYLAQAPQRIVDPNNRVFERAYDQLGRIVKVYTPYIDTRLRTQAPKRPVRIVEAPLLPGLDIESTRTARATIAITGIGGREGASRAIVQPAFPADFTQTNSKKLAVEYVYYTIDDGAGSGTPARTITKTYRSISDVTNTITMRDGFGRVIRKGSESAQSTGMDHNSMRFNVVDTMYDEMGRVAQQTLPYELSIGRGNSCCPGTPFAYTQPQVAPELLVAYVYDALGRTLAITNTVGITTMAYDRLTTTTTDALGNQKDITTDALGNITEVGEYLDGNEHSTRYVYNARNELIQLVDALGNIRTFSYDMLGRRLGMTDLHALGDATYGQWAFEYDRAGNLVREEQPNGTVVTRTYDELDRLVIEDADTTAVVDVRARYDVCINGVGAICTITTPDIQTTTHYDKQGRTMATIKSIGGQDYQLLYEYDPVGNIKRIVYPDTTQIAYAYNRANLPETVEASVGLGQFAPIVTEMNYAPTGALQEIAYANGTRTHNTYDADELYRLVHKLTTGPHNIKLQDLGYTYDDAGNVLSIVDASDTLTAKTTAYTYDELYRLTQSQITDSLGQVDTRDYTYNILGNILAKSDQGAYSYTGNTGGSYANPHAPTIVGSTTLTYDRNGNMTTTSAGESHTWNYQNRPISSTLASGTVVDYVYDHTGERFFYNDGDEVTTSIDQYVDIITDEATGDLSRIERFIYVGDTRVATVNQDFTGSIGSLSNEVFYTHHDHLGGTNVVTDEQGVIVELLDYYPFGDTRIEEQYGDTQETHRFAGHKYDDATGLTYMHARYYSGSRGQFASIDPAGRDNPDNFSTDPQQLNSYAYGRNNPVKYLDTNGEIIQIIGSDEFKARTLADIQKLSPYASINEVDKKTFVDAGTPDSHSTTPVGDNLIATLVNNESAVKIGELSVRIKNAYAYGSGEGNSEVKYNSEQDSIKTWTLTPKGPRLQKTPSEIILAHELAHAFDYMTLSDEEITEGHRKTNYEGLNGRVYNDKVLEQRAVGFLDNGALFSENAIRKEQGRYLRSHYSGWRGKRSKKEKERKGKNKKRKRQGRK